MSQALFSQARTGRRAKSSNFESVEILKWEVGKSNRIVVPLYKNEEGEQSVVIFGDTIHKVEFGLVQLPKRGSGTYSTHTIRCTHPYSQQNREVGRKIAEKQEMCVFCELENLQNKRRIGILSEKYGTEEANYEDWAENFKALDKQDKVDFFSKHKLDVEKSYFTKKDENDEEYNVHTTEMYMLVYDIEVEEIYVERTVKATGKKVKIKKYQPVIKDGKVQYKPAFLKVSGKRLNALKDALDNALTNETISYENLHTYVEYEGTEFEEEVNIGFIDFELKYPMATGDTARMDSARDMQTLATVDSESILLLNKGLLEEMQESIQKDRDNAKNAYENVYKNLQLYTREQQLALLKPEKRGEFEQLREEYRTEDDVKFENSVYENMLKDYGEEEETQDSTTEDIDETKESKPKEETKPALEEKPEPEEELETEEDVELAEVDLFEDD